MATQTSVLGLSKPAGNENALVSVLNSDMDLIDEEAGKVRGNIAAPYSASSSYAVGDLCIFNGILYKCNTAIGSGGETWNASHWTQITIDGELATLNGKIEIQTGTATAADSSITINSQNIKKSANVVCANFQATSTNAITSNAWTDFVVLPEGYRPSANLFSIGVDNTHDSPCSIQIKTNGTVSVYGASANSGMKSLKVGVSFI